MEFCVQGACSQMFHALKTPQHVMLNSDILNQACMWTAGWMRPFAKYTCGPIQRTLWTRGPHDNTNVIIAALRESSF